MRKQLIGTPKMQREDATITTAELVEASDARTTPDGSAVEPGATSSVVAPAKPQFCQVTGTIAASTKGAQPITFQVNLPTEWNGSAAQFGGGGFNGSLIDATGYISIDTNAGSTRTPLMRGYATLSTDSGHLTSKSPRATSSDPVERAGARFDFALNDEMWRNFSTDAYRKVKDVGDQVTRRYYQRPPRTWLWFGGSEGGREGLLMAQQHPKEFDGIFVRNPVIGWAGLFSNFINTLHAVERDDKAGAFTSTDIALLARTSAAACDSRDGSPDGVLSDYQSCQEPVRAAVDRLECQDGPQPGTCLTKAQLRVVDAVYEPYKLGYTLPSGLSSYPGFFFGGEEWSLKDKIGTDPSIDYGEAGYPNYLYYGAGAAKFVFAQDPDVDPLTVDPQQMQDRLSQISRDMDTVEPDLSAFRNHGGKLIVLECTNDYAQSARMGMDYHGSMTATMGPVDDFFKLYVSPGTDHGCGGSINPSTLDEDGLTPGGVQTNAGTTHGVPRNVDWATVLEDWTAGTAPGHSVTATANDPAAPFAALASKPVCAYPAHPQLTGSDPTRSDSYSCVE
ncbi:hypothetical protein ASG73_04725 [Janibacter sp. Soil728]|nr:hypothetical protein ASG73_04725 [Janibacter sp. Soil728]